MVGIDVDFSPVCDLFVKGASKSLEIDHLAVIHQLFMNYLRYFAKLKDSGVLSVPKHFPGHGRSRNILHLKVLKLNRSDLLMKTDWFLLNF